MNNSMTELMKKHRSIRNFEDRSLPDGLVEKLVSCGQRASTSSNLQAYSIIEVSILNGQRNSQNCVQTNSRSINPRLSLFFVRTCTVIILQEKYTEQKILM